VIQNGFLGILLGTASPAIGRVPALLLLHRQKRAAPAHDRNVSTLPGWNEGNAAARPDLQAGLGQTDGHVFPREMPRIQRACE